MENRLDELVKKALELFGQYGVKSVSMDDIARELAMSKKTLYNLVKDKNSLVLKVLDGMRSNFEESLKTLHNTDHNAIEQFFILGRNMNDVFGELKPAFIRDLHKYHPKISKAAIEEKNEILEAAFNANIKHGKKDGFYHEDMDDVVVAKILMILNQNMLAPTSDAFTESEIIEKEIHKEVFKYHFRAVCTSKGIDELKKQMAIMDMCKN
ncbi:MAG: TetR/AcrR family transcriptional regulator [Mangrovibacterium sp.]